MAPTTTYYALVPWDDPRRAMSRIEEELRPWDELGEVAPDESAEQAEPTRLAPGKRSRRDRPRGAAAATPGKVTLSQRIEGPMVSRAATGAGPASFKMPTALLSTSGAPIPDAAGWSRRLGADVSGARVVTSPDAAQAADAMQAVAFTVGKTIYFGDGAYDPNSQSGQRLLAHELAHTVQQRDAGSASGELPIAKRGSASEEEADRAADAAIDGQPAPAMSSQAAQVSRWEWSDLNPFNHLPRRAGPIIYNPKTGGLIGDVPVPQGPRFMSATDYLQKHYAKHAAELAEHMAKMQFSLPSPYVQWGDGGMAGFIADFAAKASASASPSTLRQSLRPDDLLELIDEARDIVENHVSDEAATASSEYHLSITLEMANKYRVRIRESLERILPRYVNEWNRKTLENKKAKEDANLTHTIPVDEHPENAQPGVTADIRRSHVVDDWVLWGLTGTLSSRLVPDFKKYRTDFPSEKAITERRKPKEIKAYEIQGKAKAPNWIRVTDPPDALAEDVATKFYGDERFTYKVTAAAPLFGLDYEGLVEQYRKEIYEAAKAADASYVMPESGQGMRLGPQAVPLQVLNTPLADEAVLGQAKNFKGAKVDAKTLSQQFQLILDQFKALHGKLPSDTLLGVKETQAAVKRVEARKAKIDGGDPGELELWGGQAREQLDILTKSVEGMDLVNKYYDKIKALPGGFEGHLLVNRIAAIYSKAASISDMVVTARTMINDARGKVNEYTAEWLVSVFRWLKNALIASRIDKKTGLPQDPALKVPELEAKEQKFRIKIEQLRELMVNGKTEQMQPLVDEIRKELGDMEVEVGLIRNIDAIDQAWVQLGQGKSTLGWIRGAVSPVRSGNERLEDLQSEGMAFETEFKALVQKWRDAKDEKAKDDVIKELQEKTKPGTKWASYFTRVAQEIKDQASYDAIMAFCVMLGIMVISGGLGALAGAAVGGSVLGFVVGLATEVAVFTALSNVFLEKDHSASALWSQFKHNLLIIGVLKGVSLGMKAIGAGKGLLEIGAQYAAINGLALYEANKEKVKKTGASLSIGEILDISVDNLKFMVAAHIAGSISAPWLNKLNLRVKLGADIREAKSLGDSVQKLAQKIEAAKGKGSTADLNTLLDKQGKLLDKQGKILDELAVYADPANYGRALDAGLTKEQIKEIQGKSSEIEAARAIVVSARVMAKMQAISPGEFLVPRDGTIDDAFREFNSQVGKESKDPAEAKEGVKSVSPITLNAEAGVKSFTVEMKDGAKVLISERTVPKEAIPQGSQPAGTAPDGSPSKPPEFKPPSSEAEGKKITPEQAEANHQAALEARRVIAARDGSLTVLVQGSTTNQHCTHLFGRVIQGGGVAAAMDAHSLPGNKADAGKGALTKMPDLIAVAAGPEPWDTRAGMRAGQPAPQLDSPGFSKQPSSFTADHKGYADSGVIADAAAMTRFDSGLSTLRDSAVIEMSTTRDSTWVVDGANVRLKVRGPNGEIFLYAKATDMALGPGEGRRLDAAQFGADPAKQAEYRSILESEGRVVMGDGPIGRQKSGKILVSGGGPTAGWNAEMAARGGGSVEWIGREGKKAPEVVDSVAKEYNENQNKLDHPEGLDAKTIETLEKRQAYLRTFGDAMLPRNTKEGGAFDRKNVDIRIDEIKTVMPSEAKDPAIKGKVWVELASGKSGFYDQVVVSHGPDIAKGPAAGLPGAVNISGTTIYRPVMENGQINRLESTNTNPPGAVRVLGNDMWSPAWIDKIAPEFRETYEKALREQAKGDRIKQGSPDSVGVPGSIHMVGHDIPAANAALRKQAELAPVVKDELAKHKITEPVDVQVLDKAAFEKQFGSRRGRAVFVLENDGKTKKIYANDEATPADVIAETYHVRQMQDPNMAAEIRMLHSRDIGEWGKLSAVDRIEQFRRKLFIEMDAQKRMDADGIAGAKETLARLEQLKQKVEALTEKDIREMNAEIKELPDYLKDPALLFEKGKETRGTPENRHSVSAKTPRTGLDADTKDASPAQKDPKVEEVNRLGNEWKERWVISSGYDGTAKIRTVNGETQVVVTTENGGEHVYELESGTKPTVKDGEPVAKGQKLAEEADQRYRLIEIKLKGGGVEVREEVFSKKGYWVQRGSEGTRRGSIAEDAAVLQADASLRARKGAATKAGTKFDWSHIEHNRGGGGFDDVIVEFSGEGKATVAEVRIREVKNYPDRYVPLADFTAIRGKGLAENLAILRTIVDKAIDAHSGGEGAESVPGLNRPVTLNQLEALQKVITPTKPKSGVSIEIVLGPTTKLGSETEGAKNVLKQLREDTGGLLKKNEDGLHETEQLKESHMDDARKAKEAEEAKKKP